MVRDGEIAGVGGGVGEWGGGGLGVGGRGWAGGRDGFR